MIIDKFTCGIVYICTCRSYTVYQDRFIKDRTSQVIKFHQMVMVGVSTVIIVLAYEVVEIAFKTVSFAHHECETKTLETVSAW